MPKLHLLKHRKMWIVALRQPVPCPQSDEVAHRHNLREEGAEIFEHGGQKCTARVQRGHGASPVQCGAFVWILTMPFGRRFVCEITEDELRYMQTQHMDADQCMKFLGADGALIAVAS